MAAQWELGGDARKHIMDGGDEAGLTAIMTGLGSLSYGELAGERMKLGLMIHDPEEEQDCFSDNTHASHFFDALGIRNVYLGTYRRADRSLVTGPSISDLVKAKSPEVDAEVRAKLDATMEAMNALYLRALTTESYDQMIGEDNDEGQRRGSARNRRSARPNEVARARGGNARPEGHQIRRLGEPRQSRQGATGKQSGRRRRWRTALTPAAARQM
jgi:putative iron-regulated protein